MTAMTSHTNNGDSASLQVRPRITCPHCWANFATEETLWITEHQELRGDPLLTPEHQQRFLPTRFNVGGNAIDPRGMTCQGLACPKCHLQIPRVLVDMTPAFVSILGIPKCGKTYFLASMTWQLRQTLPRHFHIAFSDADLSANAKLNQYEQDQFFNPNGEAIVKLEKTEVEGGDWYNEVQYGQQPVRYPRPFLFSLQPLPNHPSFNQAQRVARVLCLYDNAGESFLPGTDKTASPVTRHLARSQALLFLFDPTQHPRFRAACQGKTSDPQITNPRDHIYRQDIVLNEAANRVREHTGLKHGERHNRPLIVVVTKYDAWSSLLPGAIEDPPFVSAKQGDMQALAWSRVDDTSQRVRELLWQYSPEIVSAAEGFAKEVVYVPVSATGCSPVGEIRGIRPCDLRPKWSDVPMLLALARWSNGLIPYATRKNRPAAQVAEPVAQPVAELVDPRGDYRPPRWNVEAPS